MELDMSIVMDYIRINNLCRYILHNPCGGWDKELVIQFWKVKQQQDMEIWIHNLKSCT